MQDVERERKKRKKENWLTNPESSLVTDDDSWFAIFWVSIFVVFQVLWLLIFPVHLVVKQAHITNSFRRKSVETLIDLVYIANVFITPLIAVHWKKLDAEVLKRYKVEHLVKIKKISLLLANYADYHLLLDFLSSVVGLLTFQDTINYAMNYDVFYLLKILRLFSLVRLYEQIQMLTERFAENSRSKFPRITVLIPLIQVLLTFIFVIHQLSFFLAYLAFKRGRFGDCWFFQTQQQIDEMFDNANLYPIWALYVNCFYFGCTTLTTIGYGDFKPFYEYDRLFFNFIFVFGIIFYTLIFDKISDYISKVFYTPEQMQKKAAQDLKEYIEDMLAFGKQSIKSRVS